MEGKQKVTKEVLCEECRFILASVMAEARYGRKNRFADIQRICDGAISVPFSDYVDFLQEAGYLKEDSKVLAVTRRGEAIVSGGNLAELTQRAVEYFKRVHKERKSNERKSPRVSSPAGRLQTEREEEGTPMNSEYEKQDELGTGGIGTVYRARQMSLGREVALKELRGIFSLTTQDQHTDIIHRFGDVVREAASLSHPHINTIHDLNLNAEYPYVISAIASGGSVRQELEKDGLTPGQVVRFFVQALRALGAGHRENIYHQSLKPEQLLIDGSGQLQLSDFGWGRIVSRKGNLRQVSMSSIPYIAPEQYKDVEAASAQSDLYSLGIVLYEMCTGQIPGRRSPMPSQVNSAFPKGLDDVFDRMTQDNVAKRYSSVDDVLGDVEGISGLHELMGAATMREEETSKSSSKRKKE